MKRLNAQELRHFRGRRLGSQLIAAGEFDMTVETNLNSVLTFAAQGAPLWFAPIQPLFFSPSLLFMAQGAPHPHAAALFMDYLLSARAQKLMANQSMLFALRDDVEGPYSAGALSKELGSRLKPIPVDMSLLTALAPAKRLATMRRWQETARAQ